MPNEPDHAMTAQVPDRLSDRISAASVEQTREIASIATTADILARRMGGRFVLDDKYAPLAIAAAAVKCKESENVATN